MANHTIRGVKQMLRLSKSHQIKRGFIISVWRNVIIDIYRLRGIDCLCLDLRMCGSSWLHHFPSFPISFPTQHKPKMPRRVFVYLAISYLGSCNGCILPRIILAG